MVLSCPIPLFPFELEKIGPPEEEEEIDEEEAQEIDLSPGLPWEGSDRDYLYEEVATSSFEPLFLIEYVNSNV